MTSVPAPARVLLLVEDNPGDADLACEMLSMEQPPAVRAPISVVVATTMATALQKLATVDVDVVILDLSLPDCVGVASVSTMRAVTDVPIIVLTGNDDERLAMACIAAGAQDYLLKSEMRPHSLKRAIGYTLARQREAQLHDMQGALKHYRSLSSATQSTTVTAALAGTGAVARRNPEQFRALVAGYSELLVPHDRDNVEQAALRRLAKEEVVTRLGDASGGPRDLLDLHVAALDTVMQRIDVPPTPFLAFEARLLVLEAMGLLVDYYRVGLRRRTMNGVPS